MDDGSFEAMFGIVFVLAIIGAFVRLRTDWNAGTFLGKSKVDVDYKGPTALTSPEEETPEERLAELTRLRDKGLITPEEYDRLRGAVLADIAEG